LTLDERENYGLPKELILIAETGLGGYYAVHTGMKNDEGDSPIVEWNGEAEAMLPVFASDFGEFLLQNVRAAIENV
jgi:hypothetical protein